MSAPGGPAGYLQQIPAGSEEFLSLALVNTCVLRGRGMIDLLEQGHAAGPWMLRHGLLPDGGPGAVSGVGPGARLAVGPGAGRRLVGLRTSLGELFEARSLDLLPPQSSVDALNTLLAVAPPVPRLVWTATGPRREDLRDGGDPVGTALSRIAADGTDLLTGSAAALLARCDGPDGCGRWFLRSHAARRWCTTACGNRARSARHYAATKSR